MVGEVFYKQVFYGEFVFVVILNVEILEMLFNLYDSLSRVFGCIEFFVVGIMILKDFI